MPGNTSIATATNTRRTASSRPDIRRSQARTVPSGTPRADAIVRCPRPATLDANAETTVAAEYALRSSTLTGNNTCVIRHDRHRARRGNTQPTP
jgi:hypothetical protein